MGIIKILDGQQLLLNLCLVWWSGIQIGSSEIIKFGLLKICNNVHKQKPEHSIKELVDVKTL